MWAQTSPPPEGSTHLLEQKDKSRPHERKNDVMVAPVTSASSSTPSDTGLGPTSQEQDSRTTAPRLTHKDYRPQTYIWGKRRSGKDDYSVFSYDGQYAIKVHLRPLRLPFVPTESSASQEGEPQLNLMDNQRVTHVVYAPPSSRMRTTSGLLTQPGTYRSCGQARQSSRPSLHPTSLRARVRLVETLCRCRWTTAATIGTRAAPIGPGTTAIAGRSTSTHPRTQSEAPRWLPWKTRG